MTTAPRTPPTLARRAVAEALGTAMLLATVVGSGIMAERLTAAYWFTASTSFANPAVTLARAATAPSRTATAAVAPPSITSAPPAATHAMVRIARPAWPSLAGVAAAPGSTATSGRALSAGATGPMGRSERRNARVSPDARVNSSVAELKPSRVTSTRWVPGPTTRSPPAFR